MTREERLRENKRYWESRAVMREVMAEVQGVKIMGDVLQIYDQALDNIRKEINNIYSKYSDKTGLDVAELTKILSGVDRNKFVESIAINMKRRGLKLEDVYDSGYIKRLTRLEALKQQIYWEIQGIAPKINEVETKGFRNMIEDSYTTARTDLRRQTGGSLTFNDLDKSSVNKILQSTWTSGNYSTRTFGNIADFANTARTIIGAGLSVGISNEKMARQITERFEVEKYKATRLIRTETNYFQNQVELQSYIDEEVEYYSLLIMLDGRTSDICLQFEAENKIYRVDEAEPGYNYPPFHPNCRTTTVIEFANEVTKERLEGTPLTDNYFFEDTIKDFASMFSSSDIEHSIIIDRKTGEILEQTSGYRQEVNFNLRQWNSLEGNVIVHNHPDGSGFSPSDLAIAITKGADRSIVIGGKSQYEMIFNGIEKISKGKRLEITEDIKKGYISYIKEKKEIENLWKKIARNYGFTYRKGKLTL